jgi:hypothetical protein
MRFFRQTLMGVFLLAVTLGLLAYAGSMITGAMQVYLTKENRAAPPRERVYAVNVLPAVAQSQTPQMAAFGEIQSRRTLELRTAASGRILSLSDQFVEGGAATQGQILLQIDQADAQAVVGRATADLSDAEAEQRDAARLLVLARDEQTVAERQATLRAQALARAENLLERGAGTAASVETAQLADATAEQSLVVRRQAVATSEARIDQAATRLSRAQIALVQAERDLRETTVIAPFSGTLSGVTLVEGRLLSANEKLAELVDPQALEVAFLLSTTQYARLLDADGRLLPAAVTVTLDAAGTDLVASGHISRDAASAGATQSGRLVFAQLDRAVGFKPDDFVTVSVREPVLERAVRLPSSAVDSFSTVLVLTADDRLESLTVTVLRRQGDDVLVRGRGLDGREVVTGRTPLLGAGIKVRPVRPSDDGAAVTFEEKKMIELDDEKRAELVAMIESNDRLPKDVKDRILRQLAQARVPAELVERLAARAAQNGG